MITKRDDFLSADKAYMSRLLSNIASLLPFYDPFYQLYMFNYHKKNHKINKQLKIFLPALAFVDSFLVPLHMTNTNKTSYKVNMLDVFISVVCCH